MMHIARYMHIMKKNVIIKSRKRAPIPNFWTNFLYRVKNEGPPWSKLSVANGVYSWSLRSTSSSTMHI